MTLSRPCRILIAAATASLALAAFAPAEAAVQISGAGVFDDRSVTTIASAPGATWSFSFELPDVLAANPTTDTATFVYRLNGVTVALPAPASIAFATPGSGGLFRIALPTPQNSGREFELLATTFDTDVGSDGVLKLGTFGARMNAIGFLGGDGGSGMGTVTLARIGETAGVPEPSEWALLVVGCGAVGAALRRRSRQLSKPGGLSAA